MCKLDETFTGTMNRIIRRAHQMSLQSDEHHNILHRIASEFDLYDEYNQAPLWLSVVVDSVMHEPEFYEGVLK